jgi:hypothetical protein
MLHPFLELTALSLSCLDDIEFAITLSTNHSLIPCSVILIWNTTLLCPTSELFDLNIGDYNVSTLWRHIASLNYLLLEIGNIYFRVHNESSISNTVSQWILLSVQHANYAMEFSKISIVCNRIVIVIILCLHFTSTYLVTTRALYHYQLISMECVVILIVLIVTDTAMVAQLMSLILMGIKYVVFLGWLVQIFLLNFVAQVNIFVSCIFACADNRRLIHSYLQCL